jgi:hypothetical protein
MNYLPLILLGVLLNAGAQLLLKAGMRCVGYFEFAKEFRPIGLQVAANPFVLAGLSPMSGGMWLLVPSREVGSLPCCPWAILSTPSPATTCSRKIFR